MSAYRSFFPLVAVALLSAASAAAAPPANDGSAAAYAAQVIGRPPTAAKLDPFYQRYIDAQGIPIASSAAVPDAALLVARDIAVAMLADRPDLRRAMVASGFRVAIMAAAEGTVDLPEQRDWKKPTADDTRLTICERKHYAERIGKLSDREYWNGRARGMGGLLTSAATENLLGVPGTRYYGENIFVHEFSHAILEAARQVDPALYARVERAYAAAMQRGMWKGEYAAVTIDEYWAEGTQTWFNSNKVAVVDGRRILSDADLASYDVALYNVLSEVYGTRHRLPGDAYFEHPARVPPGPLPTSTAEVC
ncbi:glycoside hydrolase [Sphingomonas sp. KR1UV-12]|uniref:Glycoside hydrolase n=1 Tax=Sphingomonas aurea TaxID=3063994 RepID=A0ABT9ELB4_9SPHN|nr:glycoside hydrolase [Sphingomonas sp. KR1UV-12]MDP1027749.1 glycoside hydrolase [Sphingomonas sp. KR1UV-12]